MHRFLQIKLSSDFVREMTNFYEEIKPIKTSDEPVLKIYKDDARTKDMQILIQFFDKLGNMKY